MSCSCFLQLRSSRRNSAARALTGSVGIVLISVFLFTAQLSAQPWTISGSNLYYSGGNVGIGTATPSIPLEVSGAMGPTSTENLSASSGKLALNSSSGITMKAGIDTLATFTGTATFPHLIFGAGSSTSIGRSSGPDWLDIVNNGPISLHAPSMYIAAGSQGFLAQDNTSIGVGDTASGYRMFGAVWSRGSGGNGQLSLGVATLGAPYAGGNLLLVAGGNEGGAYGHLSQSDPTLIIHSRTAAGTATNQWLSFQHNTSNGVIQTGTGSLILNPASGYVGIGTTAPCSGSVSNCMLAVKGAIRANEVVVDSGWSDYVFDPSYHLQPLGDVAEYVKENRHLPGIPSAQEVAEKGISVGDIQSKLLAKIEELTLHMIDIESENHELRRRVEELEKDDK